MSIQSWRKSRDAYLKRLVVLEDLLYSSGDVVMLLADLFKIRLVTCRIYTEVNLQYEGPTYATWSPRGRQRGRYPTRQ